MSEKKTDAIPVVNTPIPVPPKELVYDPVAVKDELKKKRMRRTVKVVMSSLP